MNNDYRDRIDRIIDHLNSRIDATPTLEDLARVAQLSPFHFHRVYRAMTGETPFATMRRLRLARAIRLLKVSNKPITEIAFDVGYESSQTFSRAFRQFAGHSATQARADPALLDSLLKDLTTNKSPAPGRPVDVRLVMVEPFDVVAGRFAGPPDGLFGAFGELFDWATNNFGADNFRGIYGVPIDDPLGDPAEECSGGPRFDCCFDFGPDAETAKPYFRRELGGGLYAVTRHVGHYDGLNEKYDALYGSWLPGSAYSLRDAPAYNHYLQDPDSAPESEWETDLYVPVLELD